MIPPLHLVRTNRPSPPVSAGWLASSDPLDWLGEVARCRAMGCDVAIYPVAASAADPRAVGVFLLPLAGMVKFSSRVQELTEIASRVHAPLEAELSAGLLENESDYFFPYRVHFFHPVFGLIGFDPKDALPPARLLKCPPERGLRWNGAVPVERFAPELHALVVAAPPDPNLMLDEAAKQIGDQGGQLATESQGIGEKLGMLGKGIAGGFLLGAGWLVKGLGLPSAASGDRDSIRQWAEKNWQHLRDSRSREIDRLMKLMETDPDLGLRYALPLAGIEQSRGTAQPSWKLGQNSTRFSLGHGGGAIDGWDIAHEARLKLERQYREAAMREISLGRYDRAAYIFGNLLGDWAGAARALADAGKHRDAVAIYLHKLNNKSAAAQCLEKAGLLLQAASIYAEAKQFEKAGDLHAQLGNHQQARELWHAEVEVHRDPLQKARILSTKLSERAAALALLDAVWMSGNRADAALQAMFTIHRADGSEMQALGLMDRIFATQVASFPLAKKLNLCHQEAQRWSDAAFLTRLEHHAYRHIGETLSQQKNGTAELLAFLPKLVPGDIILARDAERFSLRKNPPKVPASGAPSGVLRPLQVLLISRGVRWDSLATTNKGVSIAGYGSDMLAVAQFRDNACRSSALRIANDPGNTEVRHQVVMSAEGGSRLFHFPERKTVHYQSLDRSASAADAAISTLRNILAAGVIGTNGEFALLEYTATSSLALHIYSEAAELRRSFPIDLAPPDVLGLDWRIAGHINHFCFTAAGFLAWRHPDGLFSTVNLGEAPTSLHLSPILHARQALITLADEVLLLEVGKPGKPPETVNLYSAQGTRPVACFLPDGSIVIAHETGGVVYARQNLVSACATLALPSDAGKPIDIAPRGDGGFAILTDQGNLLVFAR